jgi:hypothetical protein
MLSSYPEPTIDVLLWDSDDGRETSRIPEMTQSWAALVEIAQRDNSDLLPKILLEDRDFALLFFLVYPHRFSTALVGFLDSSHIQQIVRE